MIALYFCLRIGRFSLRFLKCVINRDSPLLYVRRKQIFVPFIQQNNFHNCFLKEGAKGFMDFRNYDHLKFTF